MKIQLKDRIVQVISVKVIVKHRCSEELLEAFYDTGLVEMYRMRL